MAEKVVVRSDTDNHVLFSIYKVYYPAVTRGEQPYTCHQHADLEISCILDGTGIYSCDGTDYAFSPGDVIFHRVNEGHYIKSRRSSSSGLTPALSGLRAVNGPTANTCSSFYKRVL